MMRTFTAALYGFLLTASLVAVPAASAGSLSASPFSRGFGAIGHHFGGCEGTIACRRAEASAETSANCIERPRD